MRGRFRSRCSGIVAVVAIADGVIAVPRQPPGLGPAMKDAIKLSRCHPRIYHRRDRAAQLALNKTDTVEVPVVRDVAVLQPSNPPPAPAPTTTESTETETLEDTATVPNVVTSTFDEAKATLDALSLVAESGEAAATALCAALAPGQVAKHGNHPQGRSSGRATR